MVAVEAIDAIKYGFKLLGYLIGVFVAGGILLAIGGSFTPGPLGGGNPLLMLIFILAGAAVIYAGSLGLLYKVIGDGVEVGNRSAQGGPTAAGTAQTGSAGGRGRQQTTGQGYAQQGQGQSQGQSRQQQSARQSQRQSRQQSNYNQQQE